MTENEAADAERLLGEWRRLLAAGEQLSAEMDAAAASGDADGLVAVMARLDEHTSQLLEFNARLRVFTALYGRTARLGT